MTLPVGVSTCTVTLSRPKNSVGTEGNLVNVRLSADRRLVWTATGESIYETYEVLTPNEDDGSISVDLAHVDQAGFTDRSGSAITGWSYKLTYRTNVAGVESRTISKAFQVFEGQTLVDLDKVADGPATAAVVTPTDLESLFIAFWAPTDNGDGTFTFPTGLAVDNEDGTYTIGAA